MESVISKNNPVIWARRWRTLHEREHIRRIEGSIATLRNCYFYGTKRLPDG